MGHDLTGKVALVTGGARGQGRSHALALAAAGATVVVCDIAADIPTVYYPLGTAAELDDTVATITAAGGVGRGLVVDVRDSAQVNQAIDQIVAEFGTIDILVANAGISGYAPFGEMTDEAWADMIGTNLTGVFNCIRAVIAPMRRQGYGRVVAIASGSGRTGMRNLAHYAASKWGVIGLVKSVALETATDGITVNVVCPSTVRTPMIENEATARLFCPELEHPTFEDAEPRFAALTPMGKPWLQPEDITRAVMYLIEDPGVTTGSVVEVNLGTSANRT